MEEFVSTRARQSVKCPYIDVKLVSENKHLPSDLPPSKPPLQTELVYHVICEERERMKKLKSLCFAQNQNVKVEPSISESQETEEANGYSGTCETGGSIDIKPSIPTSDNFEKVVKSEPNDEESISTSTVEDEKPCIKALQAAVEAYSVVNDVTHSQEMSAESSDEFVLPTCERLTTQRVIATSSEAPASCPLVLECTDVDIKELNNQDRARVLRDRKFSSHQKRPRKRSHPTGQIEDQSTKEESLSMYAGAVAGCRGSSSSREEMDASRPGTGGKTKLCSPSMKDHPDTTDEGHKAIPHSLHPTPDQQDKQWTCGVCNKRFSQKSDLINHLGVHSAERHHHAESVKLSKSSSCEGMDNSKQVTQGSTEQCSSCCKNSRKHNSDTGNKGDRTSNHSPDQQGKQLRCGRRYAQKSHLDNHLGVRSGQRPHQSISNDKCSKSSLCEEKGEMDRSKQGTDGKTKPCSPSGKHSTRGNANTRAKGGRASSHSLDQPEDQSKWKCSFCRSRFSQKSDLIKHLAVPSVKSRHQSTSFETVTGLDHDRSQFVHPGRTKWKCGECGAAFINRGNLINHAKSRHPDQKSFKCDKCNKSFTDEDCLFLHIQDHHFKCRKIEPKPSVNSKPWHCDACGQYFTEKRELILHIGKHSPYRCSQCDQRFQRSVDLSVHMRSHRGDTKWTCGVCKQAFVQKQTLIAHFYSIHLDI